jgi:gliding motility-associated transport system ATP-binding protein
VIEVDQLTQRYGAFEAVRGVSFEVGAGQIVGFLGPNGAGKSTTLRVISTQLAPCEGSVRVGGHDVLAAPFQARSLLGYLPERCPLYPELAVREHLEWIGRLHGLARDEYRIAAEREIDRCGLQEVAERGVSELSKGYRQRVGIGCALIHEPPVLVLDEPMSGLDPNQVLEIRALVRTLGQERTVLFSSHVLSEVEATCERAVVVHRGRIVADEAISSLLERVSGGGIEVKSEDPRAPEVLGTLPEVQVQELGPGRFALQPAGEREDFGAEVFSCAAGADLVLSELAPRRVTLEQVFGRLTQEGEA